MNSKSVIDEINETTDRINTRLDNVILKLKEKNEPKETTKIEFTNCYGKYTIEVDKTDMSLQQLIDNIIEIYLRTLYKLRFLA